MNKKDILLASACAIVIGGCIVKTVKAVKKYKQLKEEESANETMVYENE